MFNLLDGFLQALNDGVVLRTAISRILRVLAWIRLCFAILVPILSLVGLTGASASVALGSLLIGLGWGLGFTSEPVSTTFAPGRSRLCPIPPA